jgi:hypothetical protein
MAEGYCARIRPMPVLARAWIAAARLRRRAAPARGLRQLREQLVRRHAPGRSFVDVGCMWNADGATAFLAEEAGATRVTGVDIMEPTRAYEDAHARAGSAVRFVPGDLHDPATVTAVGVHDLVWCNGLLYHSPNPLLALERLRALTGELLILGTQTLPEVPGVRGACVLYPGLGPAQRRVYAPAGSDGKVGIDTPFEPDRSYANWWWGITPSALAGMLAAAGFDAEELAHDPFNMTVIARPAK